MDSNFTFSRADTFDDESIVVTDKIQDSKDVGKIFTTFSTTFQLPATQRNNEIFKHYYNQDVIDGFDARRKIEAIIKINGIDTYDGFIELNKVKLEYGRPKTYEVFFTGKFTELKSLFKDDLLSDLPLEQYNHVYSQSVVKDAFQQYSKVENGELVETLSMSETDICYPFITHSKRYGYDGELKEVNLEDNTLLNINLDTNELKPALRLKRILEAIEEKYNLVFDSAFFESLEFRFLFMWLHRQKGGFSPEDEGFSGLYFVRDLEFFTFTSGVDVMPNIFALLVFNFSGSGSQFQSWNVKYSVSFTGSGVVTLRINDNFLNQDVAVIENVAVNNNTIDIEYLYTAPDGTGSGQNQLRRPSIVIISDVSSITSFEVDLELTRIASNSSGTPISDVGNYTLTEGAIEPENNIIIKDQIPKMKVIDFMTSLFKTFNLTGFVQDDGSIFIEPLDDFYNAGNTYDITNSIDIKQMDVERLQPFSDISFRFADPKTFLILNRNAQIGNEFGNLIYNVEDNSAQDKVFGGGTYEIQTQFDKILYERLISTDGDYTNIGYGYYLDEKQEPTFGKPLIFYNIRTNAGNTPINFANDSQNIFTYNRPSNTYFNSQTINFGAEVNEFELVTNYNSLFEIYYSSYIERVFNPLTRLHKITAYLRPDFIIDYNTLIINNRKYNINDIKVNLNTRKAELNLINIIEEGIGQAEGPTAPLLIQDFEATQLSTTEISLSWTAPESLSDIRTYILVQDGTIETNILITETSFDVSGLVVGQEYNFALLTEDINNVRSSQHKGINFLEITLV